MIRRASLRWRLVAWVVGVMLVGFAIVFVVVYQVTGSELRSRVGDDVRADVAQLTEAVRTFRQTPSSKLLTALRGYVRAQPYNGHASLLFVVVPGAGTASNHPELFGAARPHGSETASEQQREDALGVDVLREPLGLRTALVPDVGQVRIDERLVKVGGQSVRVGAAEALASVTSAQRVVARSFLIAGALALALVLAASYLAGVSVSRPLRRMARIAERVDTGDLHPRMKTDRGGGEVRVLANAFNHMLDRLGAAFRQQREFVADASHELRTPLTVISGQVDVLAARKQPSVDDVRHVQVIVAREIARTTRLVDDMLLLAHSDQRQFATRRKINLPQFIRDLWSTSTVGVNRRLEVGPVPPGSVEADPDRLAQALRNLIDNAISHTTEPDGYVGLHTDALTGGRVRFTVTDDGPGIPEKERTRIFERFHRTDDARDRRAGGTGLGLAIVQAIAEAHDGRVRAVEPSGAGARVELEIAHFSPASRHGARRPVSA